MNQATSITSEILSEDMSTSQVERLWQGVERAGFHYTTTILRALARQHRLEFEDTVGADLLERFAAEFAAHESTVA
jgi:hypothetical protein